MMQRRSDKRKGSDKAGATFRHFLERRPCSTTFASVTVHHPFESRRQIETACTLPLGTRPRPWPGTRPPRSSGSGGAAVYHVAVVNDAQRLTEPRWCDTRPPTGDRRRPAAPGRPPRMEVRGQRRVLDDQFEHRPGNERWRLGRAKTATIRIGRTLIRHRIRARYSGGKPRRAPADAAGRRTSRLASSGDGGVTRLKHTAEVLSPFGPSATTGSGRYASSPGLSTRHRSRGGGDPSGPHTPSSRLAHQRGAIPKRIAYPAGQPAARWRMRAFGNRATLVREPGCSAYGS